MADARDLKSRDSKGSCGFESHLGHCENVMCNILVDGSHYICNECADEFTDRMGSNLIPLNEMKQRFIVFMNSPKEGFSHSEGITARRFLDEYRDFS